MKIEQFKNNWQPQMDSYARFSFNLDLKELEQQIRAEAEQEHAKMCESCIHKVSKEDIDAIRADAIDEYKQELKQDINIRLKSVEKYLEGETLDAWRQATRTFKDAIDYFAKHLKKQNNE